MFWYASLINKVVCTLNEYSGVYLNGYCSVYVKNSLIYVLIKESDVPFASWIEKDTIYINS